MISWLRTVRRLRGSGLPHSRCFAHRRLALEYEQTRTLAFGPEVHSKLNDMVALHTKLSNELANGEIEPKNMATVMR